MGIISYMKLAVGLLQKVESSSLFAFAYCCFYSSSTNSLAPVTAIAVAVAADWHFSEEATQTKSPLFKWTMDPVLSVSAWPKQSLESLAVSLLQKVESLAELLGYCMTLLRTCIHNPGYVCVGV